MSVRPQPRAGFALLLALGVVLLLESFAALALGAARGRLRLAGDGRLALEGDLLAASALAGARFRADSLLGRLADGERIDWPSQSLQHGWVAQRWAIRRGALLLLRVELTLRDRSGALLGARRQTLLIGRVAADTLRVSGYRPRF